MRECVNVGMCEFVNSLIREFVNSFAPQGRRPCLLRSQAEFVNAFARQADSLRFFCSAVLFTAFCFISKVFITLSGVAGIPRRHCLLRSQAECVSVFLIAEGCRRGDFCLLTEQVFYFQMVIVRVVGIVDNSS